MSSRTQSNFSFIRSLQSAYLEHPNREVFMSTIVQGSLDLRVPAVVDTKCSCFCWKKQEEPKVVLSLRHTLSTSRMATDAQCRAAVQAVFDEIIRRCHPRIDLATQIIEGQGFRILHPPKSLTVEQLTAIREALEAVDPSVPERPRNPGPDDQERLDLLRFG